jgi:hypothetical protein
VRASQAGNAAYAAALPVSQSFLVSKASQAIRFAGLASTVVTRPPLTVRATSSSGLAVNFTSTTPLVCRASRADHGAKIILLHPGTCRVRASQRGNATYAAAKAVSRSFQVLGPA